MKHSLNTNGSMIKILLSRSNKISICFRNYLVKSKSKFTISICLKNSSSPSKRFSLFQELIVHTSMLFTRGLIKTIEHSWSKFYKILNVGVMRDTSFSLMSSMKLMRSSFMRLVPLNLAMKSTDSPNTFSNIRMDQLVRMQ